MQRLYLLTYLQILPQEFTIVYIHCSCGQFCSLSAMLSQSIKLVDAAQKRDVTMMLMILFSKSWAQPSRRRLDIFLCPISWIDNNDVWNRFRQVLTSIIFYLFMEFSRWTILAISRVLWQSTTSEIFNCFQVIWIGTKRNHLWLLCLSKGWIRMESSWDVILVPTM